MVFYGCWLNCQASILISQWLTKSMSKIRKVTETEKEGIELKAKYSVNKHLENIWQGIEWSSWMTLLLKNDFLNSTGHNSKTAWLKHPGQFYVKSIGCWEQSPLVTCLDMS